MKRWLVLLLYRTGLLGLYHRLRNRNVLTVIALHRVLGEDDPRWQTCDPLYTLSTPLFEQCVRFLRAHYSVVSLEDVARARAGHGRLPPRPLLLTFDDGWVDTHRYALPILRRLALPSVLFVAADAIDRTEAFWQERVIGAWRSGRLGSAELGALWLHVAQAPPSHAALRDEGLVRSLVAQLGKLSIAHRAAALRPVERALRDAERQMVTSSELRELGAGGFAFGTHGKMHEPLDAAADVDAELGESRVAVARALGTAPDAIRSMSFPFSRKNAAVVARARELGYELLFGGGASLTPPDALASGLFARVGITAHEVVDARGELRPQVLAAQLFMRPHRALEAG